MKIYACLIVKDDNDLRTFKGAVESLKPYIDGLYVVANGKKTAEIEAYVKSVSGNFYYLPWKDDFAEQRNFLVSKLPADCDYYTWIDSDDILIGGENLRDIAKIGLETHQDVIFLDYWYGCTFNGEPSKETFEKADITQRRERLLRPSTHKWVGRLHETPIPYTGVKDHYTKVSYKDIPIAVLHLKTNDVALETMNRNKRILEMQLEEERKAGNADPRTLLYLMKIYAEIDDPTLLKKCITMGEEYLEKSGWDEERATCCDIMAQCYSKIGNNVQMLHFLHKAIEQYPFYPLLYIRLAMGYILVDKPNEAKHWLELGVNLPLDSRTSGVTHIQEMKILSAQVLLKLKYNYEKDYKGALAAAEILLKEQPFPENEQQFNILSDIVDLDEACERVDKLCKYLESIGDKQAIMGTLEALPNGIIAQPFAIKWRQKYAQPKIWGPNTICYFANFNQAHLEKWDGNSLKKGIGGSETAVIELAKEWTKLGYKVVVYGDPEKSCEIDGVTYLPWYFFNRKDYFNIFIQWRDAGAAKVIKCKKYIVDLHDLFDAKQLLTTEPAVDQYMVKSEYHKSLADTPKTKVVSNGINV